MSPSTAAPPPRLLTVTEAAEHLGTTTSKLYELVARHAIASIRIGRAIRIPQDTLGRPATRPAQADPDTRTCDLDRLATDAGETESEMHPSESARTNRVPPDPVSITPNSIAPQISEAAARQLSARPPTLFR